MVISNGIQSLKEQLELAGIVYEATSGKTDAHNTPILKEVVKDDIVSAEFEGKGARS
ncbi:hypothetical protein [Salinicoccus roseus]|uniref:hypothetical protein n=1 Tax=Salinicoccus roseus TaxID=45670 RepID=UPI001EF50302|nr:hypothetical protein [Salinicoccus roseus]MCG7333427.1 hypothetical protein [Salinicoccus roseus]